MLEAITCGSRMEESRSATATITTLAQLPLPEDGPGYDGAAALSGELCPATAYGEVRQGSGGRVDSLYGERHPSPHRW